MEKFGLINNKIGIGLLLAIFLPLFGKGAVVQKELYIHSGNLVLVGVSIPYKTFNEVDAYSPNNPKITLQVGDSLSLWVHNKDVLPHSFSVKNIPGVLSIPVGDSVFFGYIFNSMGNYIYHDPLNYPTNTFLGLAGMIAVRNNNHASFYWNIKEHDSTLNNVLNNAGSVNWNTYYPTFFTINEKSNPFINTDPMARVTGSVGDTLMLYVANTGQSIHSMHFHGYHATLMFSSRNPSHVNRLKDTHPVYPMETIVLRIIPDKPGEYPVHDHNLVATSGNYNHPNGMFTTLLINP